MSFCRERGVPHYPAQEETVADYLIYLLEDRKLARGTINNVAVSAIADLHRFDDGHQPQRSALVKNVKKAVVRLTKAPKEKRPLKAMMLRRIFEGLNRWDFINFRDYFMFVLCYKAFLRQSECSNLGPEDVWMDEIEEDGERVPVLFIFVEKRKNDQERVGHTIIVGADKEIWKCPLALFLFYSQLVRERGVQNRTGFFFRSRGSGHKLCAKHVNKSLKKACKAVGVEPTLFSSHCLRGGGTSAAIEAGIELRLVAKHGGWKSNAIYRYITDDYPAQLKVSRAI